MSANTRAGMIADFLKRAGWADAAWQTVPGDASTRRYMRLARGETTALLLDQPQNAEAPVAPPGAPVEARGALGYNAVARLAGGDCARFVAAAQHLRGLGLSAPEIYAADPQQGLLLIEDLGTNLYADVLEHGADASLLYGAAVDALVRLHGEVAPDELAPGVPLYVYDETALLAEAALFTEWFLPVALGRLARPDETEEHRALWRAALHTVGGRACYFVHRDYHAQNLFWLPARKKTARVGLIDFQDAVAGPAAYDLISLLEDARRDVPEALAQAMTVRYIDRARAAGYALDREAFAAEMAIFAAQRNTKIAGIFARLAKRDSKPRYLALLPRVWGYLEHDLAHPALAPLKAWYDRTVPRVARGRGIGA